MVSLGKTCEESEVEASDGCSNISSVVNNLEDRLMTTIDQGIAEAVTRLLDFMEQTIRKLFFQMET